MISFTNNYLCGIYLIDEQHKILCNIINNMQQDENRTKENYANMMEEIKNYSAYHFASEEAFWSQNGEKEIEAHKQLHKQFLQLIDDFASKERTCAEYEAFIINLETWIVEHITVDDRNMFRFTSHI